MLLILFKPKIFNKDDMKSSACTWYWTKEKFYINLQQFLKSIMLTIYDYSAATAAESAFCNILRPIRMQYSEYFRDKVKTR